MVPYSFDESIYPLLNKAARALNLPTRSEQSYLTLFMSNMSMVGNVDPSTVLDDRYTGTILVNDYNVCFVTPREIPVIPRDQSSILRTPSTSHKRRASMVDRRTLNFMAAIEMWVPYTCTPPNAPYVLSIPTPRCLSNQIRLRIFPPNSSQVSGSYASLSSAEDEITSWDLTSDPPVTRGVMGPTNPHSDMADDESSDSSYPPVGTYADGCGIQGNFPSSERIRVRWAAPLKPNSTLVTRDGRRQVGVREVGAETQYEILGRHNDGLLVRIDHKAHCKGVWFPGVATLVGLDIKLHSSECDVSWAPGSEPKWNVTGQTGFTGFSVDTPARLDTHDPLDTPESVATALPNGNVGISRSRHNGSPPSGSSLLRVALPEQASNDYSFEASASGLSATVSSMESFDGKSRPSSSNGLRTSPRSPLSITTVHLNMDSLLPPSNETTISVSGVILISSISSSQESSDDKMTPTEPFSLPVFRFNGLNTQSMGCIVRNAAEDLVVDVRDSKTRATTLTKGRSTRCSRDGIHIGVRSTALTMASRMRTTSQSQPSPSSRIVPPPLTQSRTPNLPSLTRVPSTTALGAMTASVRPKRDGQLMIPSVVVHVTPYPSTNSNQPDMYAVMVTLPAPTDSNSEWLEVGLAQSGDPHVSGDGPPRVHVVSASVEDVPVRYEVRAGAKEEDTAESTGVPFEQQSGKEWITWISIHVGETGGGQVKIAYLSRIKPLTGKDAEKADLTFNILLPVFTLPVGHLDVNLEPHSGMCLFLMTWIYLYMRLLV